MRFFRQRAIQPTADDKTLIALDDGTPLLIERTLGAGRMLILTVPVDRRWSDMAIHPLFVHFIGAAASYLTQAEATADQCPGRLHRHHRIDRGRRRADIRSTGPSGAGAGAEYDRPSDSRPGRVL